MEQRLGCCLHCGITLHIKNQPTPSGEAPPPLTVGWLLVHAEKLNKVLQVRGSSWHPFFGILDWPRFSDLSPLASNTTSPGGRQESLTRRCRGRERALRVNGGEPGGKCPECPRWHTAGDH